MPFPISNKIIGASAFLCLAFFHAKAQQITLSGGMEKGSFEYSGLAIHNNAELLFLPQHADKIADANVSQIQVLSLKRLKEKHLTFTPTDFKTIKIIDPKRLLDVKKSEGFEAITCINDEVYLSMETTSETEDSCFLFKGKLTKNVLTLSKRIGLPHLKKCDGGPVGNAGYESLTYLPKEKKLLAIYEYEGEANKPVGFKVDPDFSKPATPVYLDKPLCFRITDIQATKSGGYFGVNVCYEGTMKDDKYLDCHCTSDNPNVNAVVEGKTRSFAQIISFTKTNDSTYHWEHFTNIDASMPVNWEGFAIVDGHFLLINDTNNSQNKKNPNSTTYFISMPAKKD
ncbi:hypothetical protein [Taibaiella soli]|uniref:Phytase-like domain-containing protein n=1 Tax=Taibaiella soli TaxID=1649169 RepID=A0A2W2AFS6_9BACT|nr:hypothetical protein [Taibaiella soli]PZF72362.1 hypothetical protein DN068_13490 [Taibaiella soli]